MEETMIGAMNRLAEVLEKVGVKEEVGEVKVTSQIIYFTVAAGKLNTEQVGRMENLSGYVVAPEQPFLREFDTNNYGAALLLKEKEQEGRRQIVLRVGQFLIRNAFKAATTPLPVV